MLNPLISLKNIKIKLDLMIAKYILIETRYL